MAGDTTEGGFEQWLARAKAEWTTDVVRALLPMITPREAAQIRGILGTGQGGGGIGAPAAGGPWRVPVAPPVSGRPASGGLSTGQAYGTVDEAVGDPAVARPAQAVYLSPYPRVLYKLAQPGEIPDKDAGGALGDTVAVDQVSTVTIAGMIDAGEAAQVLLITKNNGGKWGALFGGTPFPPGAEFTYSTIVTPGDRFNFAPGATSQWDQLVVTIQTGVPELSAQGGYGGAPSAVPGTAPYPVRFVPVSSFPQVVIKAAAGTEATPGSPIGAKTFTAPAPGTVGVFGYIGTGAAYLTLAVEKVSGQLQYGGLNGNSNQVQGAWVAATVDVDAGDTIALSVSAACTLGSVRVTYTPST